MSLSRKKQKRADAEIEQLQQKQEKELNIKRQSIKNVEPKTENQAKYLKAIEENSIVFCTGAAGSGKSYLAIAMASKMLMQGHVNKIILCRPAVEAGERFGFLPGDLKEKIDPYLQPAYDALYEILGQTKTETFIDKKIIRIAPLAFLRGVTFKQSFVLLDEAQNVTRSQMKMFLTRMGNDTKMVINGDTTQTDLRSTDSGLLHAIKLVQNIPNIIHVQMNSSDIQRHPLVKMIVEAYEKDESEKK